MIEPNYRPDPSQAGFLGTRVALTCAGIADRHGRNTQARERELLELRDQERYETQGVLIHRLEREAGRLASGAIPAAPTLIAASRAIRMNKRLPCGEKHNLLFSGISRMDSLRCISDSIPSHNCVACEPRVVSVVFLSTINQP